MRSWYHKILLVKWLWASFRFWIDDMKIFPEIFSLIYKIILHLTSLLTEQHELMIFRLKLNVIHKTGSNYISTKHHLSMLSSERLKKRKEEKLWERNIYLNVLQIALFCSINESNIQSLLSCIWLTFITFMIHQWIIHIRKDSRILSKSWSLESKTLRKKTLSWFWSHDSQSCEQVSKITESCLWSDFKLVSDFKSAA